MQIRLFGTLVVEGDGGTLTARDLGGIKHKQLLEVLALHRRPVTKDELIDALWGERAPKDPVAVLEACVSVLRRRLQPGAPRTASVVVTEAGAYRLDRDRVSVDVEEFERLVEVARREPGPARRVAALREACGVSSRGPLLDDERYSEWADAPRRHVERLRAEARLDLARALADAGDGGALHAAEDALLLDPTCEEAYRLAMAAAARAGRQDLVARYVERCRAELAGQLGVTPSATTLDLAMRLLARTLLAPAAEPQPDAAPAAFAPRRSCGGGRRVSSRRRCPTRA